MCKITAIVLAAGTGSRMKSKEKKQFMKINGKPVNWYSLFQFEKSIVDEVILVTGEEDIEYCNENIVKQYNLKKVKHIIAGGSERYESVYNGLKKTTGDIVLIHDGARPMLNQKIIARCIEGAKKYKACVAGVATKDTVKIVDKDKKVVKTPQRNSVWITQTPQAFYTALIKKAYAEMIKSKESNVTDDAMVVETYGDADVYFVEGSYSNIKITTPEDIEVAEVLLSKKESI